MDIYTCVSTGARDGHWKAFVLHRTGSLPLICNSGYES